MTSVPDWTEVDAKVLGILEKLVPIDLRRIGINERLSDIGIDSLSQVELANELEELLDITVEDSRIESFNTIYDVLFFARSELAGK